MKYIKVFENFSVLNEEEKTLPGGYINDHTAKKGDDPGSYDSNPGKVYFCTNSTNPSDNWGSPHSLQLITRRKEAPMIVSLEFPSDIFHDKDRHVSFTTDDLRRVGPQGRSRETKEILAQPNEVRKNAYNILLYANELASGDMANEAGIGNLVKAFFEIKKMYPEYMTKNSLYKDFLQGILDGYNNPMLSGDLARVEDASQWMKMLREQTTKALKEIGVVREKS